MIAYARGELTRRLHEIRNAVVAASPELERTQPLLGHGGRPAGLEAQA